MCERCAVCCPRCDAVVCEDHHFECAACEGVACADGARACLVEARDGWVHPECAAAREGGSDARNSVASPPVAIGANLSVAGPTRSVASRRAFWEEELRSDGSGWLINHGNWQVTWGSAAASEYYVGDRGFVRHKACLFAEDRDRRGFLLVYELDDDDPDRDRFELELYFAFVPRRHRRKGVLRGLLSALAATHRGRRLWLECLPTVVPVWKRLGFAAFRREEEEDRGPLGPCDSREFSQFVKRL